MKRLLVLAALALAFQAGSASAQFIKLSGTPGSGKGSGNQPPPLGPWYNYWPLEAHFQVPAMPEYPYFSAPQTLPIGQPGGNNGGNNGGGHGYAPNHGTGPAMAGRGGYPGMTPYAPPTGYAGANPYAGYNPYVGANPYAAQWQRPPAQNNAPQANPQQQQPQARPAPTQQGSLYYPNPFAGYYPNTGRQ